MFLNGIPHVLVGFSCRGIVFINLENLFADFHRSRQLTEFPQDSAENDRENPYHWDASKHSPPEDRESPLDYPIPSHSDRDRRVLPGYQVQFQAHA